MPLRGQFISGFEVDCIPFNFAFIGLTKEQYTIQMTLSIQPTRV